MVHVVWVSRYSLPAPRRVCRPARKPTVELGKSEGSSSSNVQTAAVPANTSCYIGSTLLSNRCLLRKFALLLGKPTVELRKSEGSSSSRRRCRPQTKGRSPPRDAAHQVPGKVPTKASSCGAIMCPLAPSPCRGARPRAIPSAARMALRPSALACGRPWRRSPGRG